jgi:uncharacterized membrane protein YphA (DoxX/SURF4 family)
MVANRWILGGVLFFHALSRLPEFGLVYGGKAATWSPSYRAFVSQFLAEDVGRGTLHVVSLLAQLGPEPRAWLLGAFYGLLLVASLAFALGLFTRVAGCVAIALHVFFVSVHPLAHYGWGLMLVPFTVYVILSRAGDYASIDAWRRRRRGRAMPASAIPAWPLRLLQIHVVAMYFHTGFARIDDPSWLHGRALFEALSRALFTRFTLDLQPLQPVLELLCYAVFALEPVAVVLLWIPGVRTLCALALLAMHLLLEILTNVGWWNYIMIGGLLAFLPPPWVARLVPGVPRGTRAAPPPST